MKFASGRHLLKASLLLLSITANVSAQDVTRPCVVLVTTDKDSTTARRLEAELASMDVDVRRVLLAIAGPSIRKELQRIAKEQGAFAAVRIVPSGDEVEVWVADRVTGKTLVREVISRKDSGDIDDAVSLGAVELLRASLLEVSTVPELRGDTPPPAVERLLPPPPKALDSTRGQSPVAAKAASVNLWLAVEPGVDFGIGDLSTGTSLELDLKVLSIQGFGAQLLGRTPFSGQSAERVEGRALIRSQHLSFLGCYAPTLQRFSPSISFGLQASSITSTGEARLPYPTQEQRRVRFAPVTRIGVGWRLLPSLGLRVDGTAAYATAPLAIRIAGHDAAEYGRPTVSLSAGLELRLPAEAGE